MNKLQHVLKGSRKILVHFPMWVIGGIFQIVSFIMVLFFFICFISLLISTEMGNILQGLIGLNKGVSICIALMGSILIGSICGGVGGAIEKYLSEHK